MMRCAWSLVEDCQLDLAAFWRLVRASFRSRFHHFSIFCHHFPSLFISFLRLPGWRMTGL